MHGPGCIWRHVAILRSGDVQQHCRKMLLALPGSSCVFGDIMLRCPEAVLKRISKAWHRYRQVARDFVEVGMPAKHAYEGCGKEFMREVGISESEKQIQWASSLHVLQSCCPKLPSMVWNLNAFCSPTFCCPKVASLVSGTSDCEDGLTAYCHRHEKNCSVYPQPPVGRDQAGHAPLHGCISGVNCYDFSDMGNQQGWLGDSSLIYVQHIREIKQAKFAFCIIECVVGFDLDGLAMLQPEYELICLQICPRSLGFPITRRRKYMLLIRRSTLKWRARIQEIGHDVVFAAIFHRRVSLLGDDLLRAPAVDVHKQREAMRAARSLPPRRKSGRPWRDFHLLSPSLRGQVLKHERHCKKRGSTVDRPVCNLRQNPEFLSGKRCCPALLRRSLMWSVHRQRVVLPLEHVECQGYEVFKQQQQHDCAWVAQLRALAADEQRSLAGNGMHAACVGAALAFLLAGTERIL